MKKVLIGSIVIGISLLLVCGIGMAKELKYVQALDENFLFHFNDSDIEWYIPMVTIDGYSYVQTRKFCEMLGIEVNWEAEKEQICLIPPEGEPNEFEFELSEEAALKYAEIIFQDIFTQEYLDTMNIALAENGDMISAVLDYMTEKIANPNDYYFITCIPKDFQGREYMLVIKKSDGRIIEVIAA